MHLSKLITKLALTPRRLLLTAGLFQFVTYACYFNLTPLYPEVGHDLGVDAGTLGTLVGLGGVVSLLVQVPAGTSGDRWGRRPFFGAAVLLLVLSQIGRWQAQAPATFLVAQIVGGAAQGMATVNAWALVADATQTSRRGQGEAFGILNAGLAVGLVAGYLLAGAFGMLLGWRSMSLGMVALPLLAVPALGWVPRRRPLQSAGRPRLEAVLRSVAHPHRLALAAMAALTLGAGQGGLYLLPFALQQREMGPFTAALLLVPYVVGSVVSAPLAGWLGDRFGTRPVIACLLVIGAVALLGLVSGAGSSLLLVLCFVLIGASVNGALPLLAVRVLELGSARIGVGTLMARLRMGQSSGTFIGPALAGLVLAHAGLNAGWIALAGCLIASLLLAGVGQRTSVS